MSQAILMAGAAQIGRFLDLPTSSIAGITDSKSVDAQFWAEKTLAVTLAAQAGSNLVTQACGMQASLLGVSLEAYAADNDMLGNILRTVRGIEVSAENLGLQTIREACLGDGHYLGHPDTLDRMKADYFYPPLADRQSPDDWAASGASDLHTRAKDWTRATLAAHRPNYFPAAVDRYVRDKFSILLPAPGSGT